MWSCVNIYTVCSNLNPFLASNESLSCSSFSCSSAAPVFYAFSLFAQKFILGAIIPPKLTLDLNKNKKNVDEKGTNYVLVHTGPRELDGHPLRVCGSGFGLVFSYTTLSVRVQANIKFGALKTKSVRKKRTNKFTHHFRRSTTCIYTECHRITWTKIITKTTSTTNIQIHHLKTTFNLPDTLQPDNTRSTHETRKNKT